MGGGGGVSGRSSRTTRRLPTRSAPNSKITRVDGSGNPIQERYYDHKGRAKRDVDYINHGNPKDHPDVSHEHNWNWTAPSNPTRTK